MWFLNKFIALININFPMRKEVSLLNIKSQYTKYTLEVSTTINILKIYPQEGIKLKPFMLKMLTSLYVFS